MLKSLKKLWNDEDGLTTVEYALLLVLIVVVAVTAWTTLGNNVTKAVNIVSNNVI
jgi:Flp pilus assembly pilin Flp